VLGRQVELRRVVTQDRPRFGHRGRISLAWTTPVW
jgi:hypothetical protein